MKGGKLPLGYTIVEVLVVLAVSGVLFLLAADFITGKQSKTSFQQGSNELVSRLQAIVEEVSTGHYADIPLTCDAFSNPSRLIFDPTVKPQGSNQDCVFLGKIIHFSVANKPNKLRLAVE